MADRLIVVRTIRLNESDIDAVRLKVPAKELFLRLNGLLLLFLLRSIRPQLPAHHHAPPPRLHLDCAIPHVILVLLLSSERLLLCKVCVDEFLVIAILQQTPSPSSFSASLSTYFTGPRCLPLGNKCVLYEIHEALRDRVSS